MKNFFMIIVILIFTFIFSVSVYAEIKDGVIAKYPLDEDASDIRGNKNHGVFYAGSFINDHERGFFLYSDNVNQDEFRRGYVGAFKDVRVYSRDLSKDKIEDELFNQIIVNINIFDASGNMICKGSGVNESLNNHVQIFKNKKINDKNRFVILWSGTTDAGRICGTSSYLGIITIRTKYRKPDVINIMIPLKREYKK